MKVTYTLFIIASLFSMVEMSAASIDSTVNKNNLKEILANLYTNYNELKMEDIPFEIATTTCVVQEKNKLNSLTTYLDSTISVSTSYVQNGYTILSNEKESKIYMSNEQFISIDDDEKIIHIQDPKLPELLFEETKALRAKSANLIDSLSDGKWTKYGEFLTIEKDFILTNSEDQGKPHISKISVCFDLQNNQLTRQDVQYENYEIKEIRCTYSYNTTPTKKENILFSSIKNNPNYSRFTISDKRTQK